MEVCELGGACVSDNGKNLLRTVYPLQATVCVDFERFIPHKIYCSAQDADPSCLCSGSDLDIRFIAYPPVEFALQLHDLRDRVKYLLRCDGLDRYNLTTYANLHVPQDYLFPYEAQLCVSWRDLRFELSEPMWITYPPSKVFGVKVILSVKDIEVNHYNRTVRIPLHLRFPSQS